MIDVRLVALLGADKLNELNERLYREEWHTFTLDDSASPMERFKADAISVVSRMREDLKASTRLELQDISHMLSGFRRQSSHNVSPLRK